MLGIPLKHIFVCFVFYGIAISLVSLDEVKYKLPICAVIILQIVALFSIFKNDAAILNSFRQLTIVAVIMATIASMIVPDYFSDGIEKDANNAAPENPTSSDNRTFMQELFNDFEKRFYYLAYVFYFFIQILFFDRQIHEIEQKTGVFLNESTLCRHIVAIFKFVVKAVTSTICAILTIPKVAKDGFFSIRYEMRAMIFIYIFEILTMVIRITGPSSNELDVLNVSILIIFFMNTLLLLVPFIFSSESCQFTVVLYPTIIAIFASCVAIISALYYSVFLNTSDLVFTSIGTFLMKVFSGALVMILEQHPTQFYIYRFMFNIFAICVAIFKCSIMFSMIRDCREGRIAGHTCEYK